MTAIGIDFGTTNCVVAGWTSTGPEVLEIDSPTGDWADLGFERIMPSVFAKDAAGQALFGWRAKAQRSGRFDAIKRLFATQQELVVDDAGDALVVEEVATMLFAHMRAVAVERGVDGKQAVITVPANSRGLARHRTKICAGMAGFEVLALINEPTAAAMAHAARYPGNRQILVFDWGGGTLDVTVLNSVEGVFLEQASKGLPTRGGIDFDSRLAKAVLATVPDTVSWTSEDRSKFMGDVELAKIHLSSRDATTIRLPGGDSRRVTRPMFEEAVASLIEEARGPLERCLADLGVGRGGVDGLVMVGGTSRIPAVRRFVTELLGMEPELDVDPMTAVGEGAAIAAAIMTGQLEDNDFFVATEHALGTVTLNESHDDEKFSQLIGRGQKLPARATGRFFPTHEEQESVLIRVIEGDPKEPVDHPDSVVLQAWDVELPTAPGAPPGRGFEVTFDYDTNGILHVTAVDSTLGQTMLEEEISFGVTADKRELVKIAQRANKTVASGVVAHTDRQATDDPEAVQLVQRATVKVIPFLDGSDAEELRVLVHSLEEASTQDHDRAKAALREALAPFSYLY